MDAVSPPDDITPVVQLALAEDIGTGDITAALIPAITQIEAKLISRDRGILCGSPWVNEVFTQLDDSVRLDWLAEEGNTIEVNQVIALLTGSARSILSGERTALNFLQTLSGTATSAHDYAALVAHTSTRLLDTRKTLPCLRTAQKYAVKTGGCHNHRMGLHDAFLIKENHIEACGGIEAAVTSARALDANKAVEVEVENIEQLQQALDAGADIIMLDNFPLPKIREAVALNGGRSKLEASGGIDDNTLVKIAETGVDYVSIGALTKHCKAFDLTLLVSH